MPRQVDQEERRRTIAEAVCRLADELGLEGVTLRDVADRAGLSMGAVQRCFRTKDEMLVFALRYVGARVADRVRAQIAASPAQSARSRLGHVVTEVALLGAERRAEARVWLAFVAQAAVAPALAEVLRADYAALHRVLTALVAEATGAGDGADGAPGPEREARALLALADGLTAQVLVGHLTAPEAREVLHHQLTALWERGARPPEAPATSATRDRATPGR
ncbi:TetR family transcriptional regulator C-terminal domain-containing protein [Streptomyces sp. LP05-1]|uniref:TetR family transcriptional regulator C-terminal domain-containing protein n=1 Tax=Streptomyces pyxinae TaxID=2970734 RepID=A0ABT2CLR9_9ACTN|nr:TetR/AcrR family transcriptional regulator [Streptomyces sp. LP05-1]MCS0638378.1 TetR family transcriptional regulator C-terminal domain-containing protein [Streptomyces sp. LP05-1]